MMKLKTVTIRKYALLTTIVLTTLAPLAFLRLNEPTFNLNLYKLLAKAGSLCGTVLLIWQCLIGCRVIGGKLARDFIGLLNGHQSIGKYVLFLILLHPIFITLYYLEKKQINPFSLSVGLPFDLYVVLGITALIILFLVVVTSVFFRTKMSFPSWFGLHVTSYAAIILIFIHSLPIGQTIAETPLGPIWVLLAGFVVLTFLYRLLQQAGIGQSLYTISKVEDAGNEAVEIVCRPQKKRLMPEIGQFIYFRRNRGQSGRPFTVSRFDQDNLSITVKAQGSYSTGLQAARPGEKVYLDGPYGIFMQRALETRRPLVMIAGGIGITPFYRLLTAEKDPDRDMALFYGSTTTDEIIYRKQLDEMKHVKVVHVISDQDDYEGEKGFITRELIEKYVRQDLTAYEFLLCGPPVMILKIEQALLDAGIPSKQIHHELFSF
jgi:3-phenylpropionate/trans-cinnamate dioxygenase ferredoxin reductase subunit